MFGWPLEEDLGAWRVDSRRPKTKKPLRTVPEASCDLEGALEARKAHFHRRNRYVPCLTLSSAFNGRALFIHPFNIELGSFDSFPYPDLAYAPFSRFRCMNLCVGPQISSACDELASLLHVKPDQSRYWVSFLILM